MSEITPAFTLTLTALQEANKEIKRLSSEGERYRQALSVIQFRGTPEIMAIAIEALDPAPVSEGLKQND